MTIIPVKQLLRHWDSTLLGMISLALCLMAGFLVLPKPVAELKLQPMPVQEASLLSFGQTIEPNALPESTSEPSQKKGKRHRRAAGKKKPAKPPILNLNTASLQQLQLLPGIGPKMAERIVEYRKTHGAFPSPEAIMDVKGIGAKKFEKMKPYLKV